MAVIKSFRVVEPKGKRHPTEVDANIRVFGAPDRAPIVQIDTFGSDDRKMHGKQSQTIQLDEKAARQLFKILRDSFGFE
ncbi:methionyl-tRNA formyltransferase [Bradyrhizobium sp.]|uniref:methionyl-tRNA formyltransferase n=1 Tax=Bradyrhizobium sp. TaxID=376 RepID=UPI0039E40FF9